MPSVSVNPPRTPVTKGSNGMAPATVPNVCKMPGPPAPFVPTPLPNIGRSILQPKGYSNTVKFEGQAVAIKGATFGSIGDIASKPTGGGIVSANTHGPTAFIAPGSLDVKVEGKNVHLLGDAMTNNNGSPPNAGTTAELQAPQPPTVDNPYPIKCADGPATKDGKPCPAEDKFGDCDKKQICAKCDEINKAAKDKKLKRYSKAEHAKRREKGDRAAKAHRDQLGADVDAVKPTDFAHACAHDAWKPNKDASFAGYDPDHVIEIQIGGSPDSPSNFKMMSSRANRWMGTSLKGYQPSEHTGVAPDCCG